MAMQGLHPGITIILPEFIVLAGNYTTTVPGMDKIQLKHSLCKQVNAFKNKDLIYNMIMNKEN